MKRQHEVFQFIFVCVDALSVGAAWILSYYLRFFGGLVPVRLGIPPFELYSTLLFLVVPIWLVFFRFNHLYDMLRGQSRIDEVIRIVQGGTLATLFLVSITFFYREYTFSRVVIVFFLGIALVLTTISRAILHRVLKVLRRRGFNTRRVLIVGNGPLAELVADKMLQYPGLGLRLEGFIDAGNGGEKSPEVMKRVVGDLDGLVAAVAERHIDQVIIALPRSAHKAQEEALKIVENEMVDIKVVPDLLEFVAIKTGLEDLDGIPIINLSDTPLSGWYSPVKRAADIVISLLALTLLSPLMLLLALLVKLTSPGPVFYRQERMGLDGRVFTMFKFRSMRADAEAETGAVWARENDPRRTRLGTFLRRTSLDELPQLLNILRGEMSFVGPRPERPEFVGKFRDQIPKYMIRHRVKCGLTGWAQVNGYRGNTSLEKRIEFDIFYIENWSLSFDIKIIWLTLWKGFYHKHAY